MHFRDTKSYMRRICSQRKTNSKANCEHPMVTIIKLLLNWNKFCKGKVNICNSLMGYLIHVSWQEPGAFHLSACHCPVDTCPAFDVPHGAGNM